MQKIRAAVMPVLLLVLAYGLAWYNINISEIAQFDFIWDALLGVLLGIALAMLPTMSGFKLRKNAATGMYWICGFLTLLLIFYQYMTMVTGMKLDVLAFMHPTTARVRIVEGVILGYCSLIAGRGKI